MTALGYDLTELTALYAKYGEGRWFQLSPAAAQQLPQMMFQYNTVRQAAGLYPVQIMVRNGPRVGQFAKIGGIANGFAGLPPESYYPDSYAVRPSIHNPQNIPLAPGQGFVVTVPD